ncbi:putative mitogen-activated protein kinase kinase kinase A-like [Capsicum annuum]|nr:putative mitogen-activated protein kinase kinase kinase A-like [Capsicum annuum]
MDWTRGHGSSAAVSVAKSRLSGEVFAVKSVELSKSQLLQKEPKILSKLSSPYIISYNGYDVTKEDDRLMFNLMIEYMSYGTLTDEIRKQGGRINEPLIGWVDQVERDGGATEPISGTPMFMAPEVARGEEQGCPCDIWSLGSLKNFIVQQILTRPVGQSLPLISTFHTSKFKNNEMTSKKVNSQSTASKAADSKFSAEVESILGVTFESVGAVTRSKAGLLGQQTYPVSSAPAPVFGSSTSKGTKSNASASEGGSSMAESLKKTLALLEHSGSKYSGAKKEQLANLTKAIEGLTNYVQNQEARIDKIVDRVEGLIGGEFSHAPRKAPEVHEIENPMKQTLSTKEVQVSAEGMIPIGQLREFIKESLKDKYDVVTKTSFAYAKPYTARINSLKMLAGYQPPKFQQFEGKATRAHDMELSMSSAGKERVPIHDPRRGKDKQEPMRWGKFVPKNDDKESMNVNVSPVKVTTKHKLIELPEIKHPNEAGRTNDPNYCKYHRLISHPLEKCFVFKDKVMQLAKEKKIFFDDETASSHQISITFGLLDQVKICVKEHNEKILELDRSLLDEDDDEGWTLVTRCRRKKMSLQKETYEQPTGRRMVKKLRKQKLVELPNKTRVMELRHQKPQHPVTLEEFLPSWFRNKTPQVNLEASCFNTAKEGAKGENLPMKVPSSSKRLVEALGEEAHICDTKITFTNNDLLLGETIHNHPLYMVGQILGKKINRILIDEGFGVNFLPIL